MIDRLSNAHLFFENQKDIFNNTAQRKTFKEKLRLSQFDIGNGYENRDIHDKFCQGKNGDFP